MLQSAHKNLPLLPIFFVASVQKALAYHFYGSILATS